MRFYFTEQLSDKMFRTPEGFLLCKDTIIARTGEQLYTRDEMPFEPDGNGFIHVDRPPEEVFKPESIASYAGKPFVIDHPTEDGAVIDVTPMNWRDLAVGVVLNPRRGSGVFNDVVLADLMVTDAQAIDTILVKSKRQLSCGYDAEYEQVGPGKARQVNIIGNHVALVDSARCGPKCRIYDSAENIAPIQEENKIMPAESKFGWLGDLLSRATKTTDAAELAALAEEGQKKAQEVTSGDGDHTHIHLHPHSAGEDSMSTPNPNPMPPAAPKAPMPPVDAAPGAAAPAPGAAAPNMATLVADVEGLKAGHAQIQGQLAQICEALGIGAEGEEEPLDVEGEGEGEGGGEGGGGFGDEANLHRETPQFNHEPNSGIYEAGDYTEGNGVGGDHPGPVSVAPKKIARGFGAEAPAGSSGAVNLGQGDQRRRARAGDAAMKLQSIWDSVVADAEIIIPGIRVPTFDSKANPVSAVTAICGFRKRVLNHVSQDMDRAADLESITAGADLRRMTCDSAGTVYRALASMYRDRNNQAIITVTGGAINQGRPASGVASLSDLSKRLAAKSDEIWGTGGSVR